MDDYDTAYLEANATTQVFTGKGRLIAVTIDTKGASSNTLKIYDATSGTDNIIADIDTTSSVGTFYFGRRIHNGLRLTMSGGTAAKVTVVYTIS